MTTDKPLTKQQEKFACELGSGKSQADAYRAAYPSSLKWKPEAVWVAASRLAAHATVALRVAEIQQLLADETVMDRAAILKEIARLALFDPRNVVNDKGQVKTLDELDRRTAAGVASYEIDEYGRVKYKFWDKNSALEKAAKHLGLFEQDNKQKVDPLVAVLAKLNGNTVGVVQSAAVPEKRDDDDDDH